jgi:hypothetical protein
MRSFTATARAAAFLAANTQFLIEAMYTVGLQTQIVAGPVITANASVSSGGITVGQGANGQLTVTELDTSSPGNSPCNPVAGTYSPPAVGVGVGIGANVTAAAKIGFLGLNEVINICGGSCFHHVWQLDSWCFTL